MKKKVEKINQFIEKYFLTKQLNVEKKHLSLKRLTESMSYSCLGEGKRFRPALSLLVTEMLGGEDSKVLPFAVAVEMVHTYSLIHDDLPCMDDDDERRGRPTNHKVFGEDTALIAGDALLTESFALIANSYHPEIAIKLIKLLTKASGDLGMIGGQAIDLSVQKNTDEVAQLNIEELLLMHELKTGALIRVAVEGAAVICQTNDDQYNKLKIFGETLGLCFQIADDILDIDEENQERGSFIALMGLEKTKSKLTEVSNQALDALSSWDGKSTKLKEMVNYNMERTV